MGEKRDLRTLLRIPDEQREEMLRAAVDSYTNGDLAHAETILVGLIALDDTDVRSLKLLASTRLLKGRHRDAEQLYERVLEHDPHDPYTVVALAEIKLKALKLDEAIPLFEQLFAADPNGTHPAANRGREVLKAFHAKMAEE